MKPESCCSYLVRLHSESSCTRQCHFRTLFRALRRLGDGLFVVRSYYSFSSGPTLLCPAKKWKFQRSMPTTKLLCWQPGKDAVSRVGVKVTYKSMLDFFFRNTVQHSLLLLPHTKEAFLTILPNDKKSFRASIKRCI